MIIGWRNVWKYRKGFRISKKIVGRKCYFCKTILNHMLWDKHGKILWIEKLYLILHIDNINVLIFINFIFIDTVKKMKTISSSVQFQNLTSHRNWNMFDEPFIRRLRFIFRNWTVKERNVIQRISGFFVVAGA